MTENNKIIEWLLQGDPAVRWQVHAYLLEAFHEYLQKIDELKKDVLHARNRDIEFLLQHRLYKSHRTGRTRAEYFLNLKKRENPVE
jgi:hypothetical protein